MNRWSIELKTVRTAWLLAGTLALALIVVAGRPVFSNEQYARVDVESATFKRRMAEEFPDSRHSVAQDWLHLLDNIQPMDTREQLTTVNQFFHKHVTYVEDDVVWGSKDYWATPLETLGHGRGDCEDYVIGKYVSLLHAGVPNSKLRLIYVRAQVGGAQSGVSRAHMVLGYYPEPGSEPLILDSLMEQVLPASERPDLKPVFSFNTQGLWSGQRGSDAGDPTARLSRWRSVLQRMEDDGVVWR
ncbi:transglutaminase-like cysteine peptidase [Salicola sp. Rm-C-2C1-2]|uniref:transglutaminase-like cysteine peptidase n=1 Tax=Salicola sp. Rm-C-2C1-2 TaxID=3141321 RepID=UPI0032E3AEBE